MILGAQNVNWGKTVTCGLRWYASDRYGLLITVGGVGGDFSQNRFYWFASVPRGLEDKRWT